MAELHPAPFEYLLKRMFLEYEREGKIFDLPGRKFHRPDAAFDTSVRMHGRRASSPLGPAAGPQDQMAQNIVLAWLAGSRVLELKTVQINDELTIPRPCIDAHNIGFNIEWSQELKLEESLKEYVTGSMLIDILKASPLFGFHSRPETTNTIFDMSVGYDLKGISTPRVRHWIESMKDAKATVEEFRARIPGDFRSLRQLDFQTRISDTLTLSTFHGCPAHEIEGIVDFLLREMGLHVIIKLNPTLLGKDEVDFLLHEVMGYNEIRTEKESFDKDLQFEQALEICSRLDQTARSLGRRLGVKFSNTLVVVNNNKFFPTTERMMYLSGQPLHVITLRLVQKWRDAVGDAYPISFSAGIDAHNFPRAVAMNLTPITTCTDLLRPGGYARLPNYMEKLKSEMGKLKVHNLHEFVLHAEGQAAEAADRAWAKAPDSDRNRPEILALRSRFRSGETGRNIEPADPAGSSYYAATIAEAGLLNGRLIVERTTRDERYFARNNRATPRKIGSHLFLFDCINCDKCVPVCPNDANFVYETEPWSHDYSNYRLTAEGLAAVPGGHFEVQKAHQLATFQDFCNECGNCDVFCPEDGGPYVEKPRLFASVTAFEKWKLHDGFLIEVGNHVERARARIKGEEFILEVDRLGNRASFRTREAEIQFDYATHQPISHRLLNASPEARVDMRNYLITHSVLRGVLNPKFINYLNISSL